MPRLGHGLRDRTDLRSHRVPWDSRVSRPTVGQLFISIFRAVACSPVDIGGVFFEQFGGMLTGLVKPSTDTPRDVLHRYKAVALESKPRWAGVEGGRVRDLVETALGVVLVACLALAALLLPCALIDIAAGTTLLGPVTVALLLCLSAAGILGVVAVQQRRYSGKSGDRSSENKGSADNGGTADGADKSDWRRR